MVQSRSIVSISFSLRHAFKKIYKITAILYLLNLHGDYAELYNKQYYFWLKLPGFNHRTRAMAWEQIFNNECARQINCLTSWNAGEEFPSLGIGHFIWHRENQNEIFQESFPELIEYFAGQNINIPAWIEQSNYDSPWQSRDDFLADFSGAELTELRLLLTETFQNKLHL